jgi:ABC-2 type transport system ATP-binding protein
MDPLLNRFGIYAKKHALAAELSAGQLTRLMLVKAFLVKPRVILFDEPTASLDPDMAQEVCRYILEMARTEKISVLFTSHKMEEVAEVCDRVLFLQQGMIVADDTPQNLARSASSFKLHLVIGEEIEKAIKLCQRMGFTHTVDNRCLEIEVEEAQIALYLTALAHENITYASIRITEPTLEDYFLRRVRS